jgi:hypothetical protein
MLLESVTPRPRRRLLVMLLESARPHRQLVMLLESVTPRPRRRLLVILLESATLLV